MMQYRNEYENLKREGEAWGVPADAVTQNIFSCGAESVTLTTAKFVDGRWAYGYVINFVDGRRAERMPGDLNGWFASRKDAQLYFLGYMLQNRKYFTEECIKAVKLRVLGFIENDLFA